MRRALAVFVAVALSAAAAAHAGPANPDAGEGHGSAVPIQGGQPSIVKPSNLDGRYALGLGWAYVNGYGSPTINNNQVSLGSLLDAPKLVVTKIGFTQSVALEPMLAFWFVKVQDADTTPFMLRLTPLVDYAVFQKDKVNLYLKGGISLGYSKDIPTVNSSGHATTRYSDFTFGIPLGFGIEWWMIENLAFDISAVNDFFYLDAAQASKNANTKTNFAMAIGNFMASLSLMFWF